MLEYVAVNAIAVGDYLGFNYHGFALAEPCEERRAHLSDQRLFDCACSRCVGPDLCRPMFCRLVSAAARSADRRGGAGCSGLMLLGGADGWWRCGSCAASCAGEVMTAVLRDERVLLADLKRNIDSSASGVTPAALREADRLRACATARLPQTHHFWPRCFEHRATLSASEASVLEGMDAATLQRMPRGMSFRKSSFESAVNLTELIAWENSMQALLARSAAEARLAADDAWNAPLPERPASPSRLPFRPADSHNDSDDEEPAASCGGSSESSPAPAVSQAEAPAITTEQRRGNTKGGKRKGARKAHVAPPRPALVAQQAPPARTPAALPTTPAEARARVKAILLVSPACEASVAHAFHAGMDFIKAGSTDLAALLFRPYEALLMRWLRLGDPHRRIVLQTIGAVS